MNVVKRIIFEILFIILFTILMPWHFIHALILLTWEVCRVYPREIYNLTANIIYGEENS
jgi:hypothetical protein